MIEDDKPESTSVTNMRRYLRLVKLRNDLAALLDRLEAGRGAPSDDLVAARQELEGWRLTEAQAQALLLALAEPANSFDDLLSGEP